MNEPDIELLRKFVRQGDQAPFASVVRRHVNLVYGTAVRKLEDQAAAEEVTQNVFTALARKAWQFAPDDSLSAWLHRATLLEAKNWLRGELRRQRREKTAGELGTTMTTTTEDQILRGLIPMLDEALLTLREKDRVALLLRFYEGNSLREIGTVLGVGEDAAQKRVANALQKLAGFFQRRGFKTATGAVAAAALEQSATSAPAVLTAAAANVAANIAPASLLGFELLLSRIGGLTKTQTASVCLALVAGPLVWQLSEGQRIENRVTAMQAMLESAQRQEGGLSETLENERADLARTSSTARQTQTANEELRRRSDIIAGRIRGLLTDPAYRWPQDLPYVRIPKAIVKDLEVQGPFSRNGQLSEVALELYGLLPEEQAGAETALRNYWNGVEQLMAASAYETNAPATKPSRVMKTVVVPPLGEEMRSLAEQTRLQLDAHLGEERAKLLFEGWDEGAIQLFWPGNLWNVSEEPQQFTVWIDPSTNGTHSYGGSWSSTKGGGSSEGRGSLDIFPAAIRERFFDGWLQQFGITTTHETP